MRNSLLLESIKLPETKSFNILVFVRIRPALKSEIGKEIVIKKEDDRTITIETKTTFIKSMFDGTFDESATQQAIFSKFQRMIPAVLNGFNCTIFAYGQTGSGKTHSMFGSDWENLTGSIQKNSHQSTYIGNLDIDNKTAGLIPRSIYSIFQGICTEHLKEKKIAIYCSFFQIYNEKIYDLLTVNIIPYSRNEIQESQNIHLQIHENKIDGIYVEGLTEFCVNNYEDCFNLMKKGEKNRYTRQTSYNVKSSRSHTIFQIIIESTIADKDGKLQRSKLNLCDLAGSEKLRKDEEIEITHFNELRNINQSLTTLGKVIHNLSMSNRLPVPYRESKLTRLLQDSLGGNTQTYLIATVAPTIDTVDESLNTIKFAERANHITTKIAPNRISVTDDILIQKLQSEIYHLKEILGLKRKATCSMNEMHQRLLLLQEENERLREKVLSANDVEKLIAENRDMKMELQRMKVSPRFRCNGNCGINASGAYTSAYGPYTSGSGAYISCNGSCAGSNSGYAISSTGYTSGNSGYASSNSGYVSSNGGYVSSNGGYTSPNGGYANGIRGYASANSGYTSSSGDYASGSGLGYASSSGSRTSGTGNGGRASSTSSGNHASSNIISCLASGGLANSGNASGSSAGGLPSGSITNSLVNGSGNGNGGHASGTASGNHPSGTASGNHASCTASGNHASSTASGNHASSTASGNHPSGSGTSSDNHPSGTSSGNRPSVTSNGNRPSDTGNSGSRPSGTGNSGSRPSDNCNHTSNSGNYPNGNGSQTIGNANRTIGNGNNTIESSSNTIEGGSHTINSGNHTNESGSSNNNSNGISIGNCIAGSGSGNGNGSGDLEANNTPSIQSHQTVDISTDKMDSISTSNNTNKMESIVIYKPSRNNNMRSRQNQNQNQTVDENSKVNESSFDLNPYRDSADVFLDSRAFQINTPLKRGADANKSFTFKPGNENQPSFIGQSSDLSGLNVRYRGRPPLGEKKQSPNRIDYLKENRRTEEKRKEHLKSIEKSIEKSIDVDKIRNERQRSEQPREMTTIDLNKSYFYAHNMSTIEPEIEYNIHKIKQEIEVKYNNSTTNTQRKSDYYIKHIIRKNEEQTAKLRRIERNI